jgi:hypothetical protein
LADFQETLGRKKEEAIIALVSRRSIEEAARACYTPSRTLFRWLKEPAFDAVYRAARRGAYGQSIARLQQASTSAVGTLLKIMDDQTARRSPHEYEPPKVLTYAAKSIELEGIQTRTSDLEHAATEIDTDQGSIGDRS